MNYDIEKLTDDATLLDVASKLEEIFIALNAPEKVGEIGGYQTVPIPEEFLTEPANPWGTSLYSKIRYRDLDGLSRVVYSKSSSTAHPSFLDTNNRLYFATNATYVKAYVYKNDAWEAVGSAYFGYLPSGEEQENLFSTTTDIKYYSGSSKTGVFREKDVASYPEGAIGDLNDAIELRLYNITATDTDFIKNTPTDNVKGTLINSVHDNVITQTLHNTLTNTYYVRVKKGSTWSSWATL